MRVFRSLLRTQKHRLEELPCPSTLDFSPMQDGNAGFKSIIIYTGPSVGLLYFSLSMCLLDYLEVTCRSGLGT